MKLNFTPRYTVSYKGVFHKAGVPFEIEQDDRSEMERHGTVETPVKPTAPPDSSVEEDAAGPDRPVRKGGRPRKAVSA